MGYVPTGTVEPIVATALNQFRAFLVGKTSIKVKIWRLSNKDYLDWSDMTFRPGFLVSELYKTMTEVSQVFSPGEYIATFDTSAITNPIANDTYEVIVLQIGENDAANFPQVGELRVGQYLDELLAKPYVVLQSFSYNQVTGALTGIIWVEHGNLVYLTSTNLTLSWFDKDGNLMFTETDAAPDAQGMFKISKLVALLQDTSYYAVARVNVSGVGVVSGAKGIFTVG